MIDVIKDPWPWYMAGPLIGLIIPALLILGNKPFGISSSLKHICAACFPANISFFKYDWKKESWNLVFILGIIVGAFIAEQFLSYPATVNIDPATVTMLKQYGIKDFTGLLPLDVFSWQQLFSLKGFIFTVTGGFLVGFGTRYADGCTSGHSIMGLSTLQWPSLVATICFMIGGIIGSWFIIPYILNF